MKSPLTAIFLALLLAGTCTLHAQTGHGLPADEEFNVFLLAIAVAFVGIVVGVTLVGSMVVTLGLLGLLGLVTAGMLSAGILVGLYRRSAAAGFKTVIAIAGCAGGIVIGEIAFYFINRIYTLHLSGISVLLIGGFCGLVAGLVLGMVLFQVIRGFLNYCRAKLSF